MSLSKADTRLSQAVDILAARSNIGLKERLIIAWTEALVRIEPEDLPTDLRSSFEDLVARLTHRGTIQNTLQEMGDGDIDTSSVGLRD
jgi:hypothetical protein